jgi:predicted acyl esterase
MSVVKDRFGQVGVPAFIMGGWYDYYPGEAFDAFNALKTQSGTRVAARSRVIIGPWSH